MALATRALADTAGGTIIGGGQTAVRINGVYWAVVGDPIVPHGTGPHAGASMASGSSFVRINGVPACRQGDAATCGHTATGSGPVDVSS